MKRFIVLALFLSQAAFADDYYTPARIKSETNADLFNQTTTLARSLGYNAGVANSIKTVQDLGFVPKLICYPDAGVDVHAAVNALDPAGFAATTQGGTMYIYYALLAKYPCR